MHTSANPTTLHVHCRCGNVQLALTGAPVAQLYCHCDDCRAMHAAAYIAVAVYPADAVTMTRGDVQPRVLKTTRRMACRECGGHVFSDLADMGLRSVNAFLLPPGVFQPQMHLHCRHAVLPVVDDLPHYQTFPAVFGGSDDLVDW